MRNTGRLYAFDVSGHRLAALQPRLARSGLANVHPAQIAHERDDRVERLAGKIDRVLVDAPCSGSGTLRRNPDLKWRQSSESVADFAASSSGDPRAAARLVKPGGRLVYATCSVLTSRTRRSPTTSSARAAAPSYASPHATLSNARAWRVRTHWVAIGCACGPIAMQPTVSLPPFGNVLEDASDHPI